MDEINQDNQLENANLNSSPSTLPPQNNTVIKIILISVFIFLLLVSGLLFILESQLNKTEISQLTKKINKITPSVISPSSISTSINETKPIYSAEDYVVFAHYNLGYTVEYPANILDMRLVGATGGNFTQTYNDGSSTLIYDIYPEENTISKTSIDNMMELSECGEGGCSKFFKNKDYEKLQEKKIVNLDGNNVFWVKTIIPEGSTYKLPPHTPIKSATIERYIIPQKNRFLILELNYKDKKSDELLKTVSSFRLIPNLPLNWIEHKDDNISKLKFKYPNEYKFTEYIQKKQIEATSLQGTVIINYFDKNDGISKYFNYKSDSDFPYLTLESGYSAEKYLNNDITKLKFSINAFTFRQGGDIAIRVFNSDKQQVTVYFYTTGSSLTYRISAPKTMETIMNQMLVSVNELMNK